MSKDQGSNIREDAALAGVSIATVSRALQQPDKVRPETRKKVFDAVRQANFVPNAQAASFRRQSNNTVILLVRDIGNPFYLEIYKGVEEAAGEAGFKVLMGDARNDENRVATHIDMVRQKHADGLILMTGQFPSELLDQGDALPPIVIASETVPGLALPTVKVDNRAASKNAMRHLIEAGHQRIVHLAGPVPESLAQERFDGYRAALAEAGIAYAEELVVTGDYSIEAGRQAIGSLLEGGIAFTAIFASSDQMAIGAISELRARGVSVPADVSVIGFDDIIFANAFEPPLTTVRQPRQEMGRRAMALMVDRLNGKRTAETIVLDTELVVRGSVAPCRPPHR
ncbi:MULTISPECIES: LacI family DNA-binding transcriptional regulator [Rhizobium/Agrobacterium group]|uniref:LacI family DNA-binding transcriptional regulator n=1 Tax=Rhizobium/Agrobacterium group TaxID=227290 RepID=UPI00107F4F1F|nr:MULTISPECIES: LacI family DNA-binding transcriptional regulator [Rhizobium/Agrobacterium group]MBB4403743.1 LacI family repressor for deo operon, udp, cdd, tsx, nupC, and nupG [Agrobacterium radiobacter]MBB5589896.1 LacI family repressor for deo operon, udp, cdd, tsx, nupC, and nupG [Agrobacterium radiobacter]TGE87408.1 LacI family transcriptional regulator [Rhizobium sp. SEMIA 4032]